MARRGEGQFVAIEVNLSGDPKLRGLARRLRISRPHAIGLVALWREFVLTKGSGADGIVKGYTKTEIAEFLEWEKRPAQLISALRESDFLGSRRGAFLYPHWPETITGWYAAKKATDRRRHRKGGDGNLQGDSAEPPRNGHGGSAEIPSGSGQEVSKTPPGAPPGGVGEPAAPLPELADLFVETYPKMQNPAVCRRMIRGFDEGTQAQLRYALPIHARIYREKKQTKAWRFVPFAPKYLRDQTFWEFQPPKPKANNGHRPDPAEVARLEAEAQAKYEHARQMLERRAVIRERLKAEGIGRHELERRIDEELAKELPS